MVVMHNKTGDLYQLIDDECKAKINGEWIMPLYIMGRIKKQARLNILSVKNPTLIINFIDVDDIKPNSEYSWLIYRIYALKEVAAEYPGKTIESVIVQLEARRNELNKSK